MEARKGRASAVGEINAQKGISKSATKKLLQRKVSLSDYGREGGAKEEGRPPVNQRGTTPQAEVVWREHKKEICTFNKRSQAETTRRYDEGIGEGKE